MTASVALEALQTHADCAAGCGGDGGVGRGVCEVERCCVRVLLALRRRARRRECCRRWGWVRLGGSLPTQLPLNSTPTHPPCLPTHQSLSDTSLVVHIKFQSCGVHVGETSALNCTCEKGLFACRNLATDPATPQFYSYPPPKPPHPPKPS